MKQKLLILLLVSAAMIAGCSKGNEPAPVKPVVETKQGVNLEFVVDKKLTTYETVQDPFSVNVVMIWKATGKDFVYNGPNDGTYAYDNIAKASVKADYSYSDVTKATYDLSVGKYFIAIVTNGIKDPRYANSYTNFEVKASEYLNLKKNVTTMVNYKYTAW